MVENAHGIVKTIVNDPHYWVPSLIVFCSLIWMGARYVYLARETSAVLKNPTGSTDTANSIDNRYSQADDSSGVQQTLPSERRQASKLEKQKKIGAPDGRSGEASISFTFVTVENDESNSSLIKKAHFEQLKSDIVDLNLPEATFKIVVKQRLDQSIERIEIVLNAQPSFIFKIRTREREFHDEYLISYTTFPDFETRDVNMFFPISMITASIKSWISNQINAYLLEQGLDPLD
jgi:hypothetical protein